MSLGLSIDGNDNSKIIELVACAFPGTHEQFVKRAAAAVAPSPEPQERGRQGRTQRPGAGAAPAPEGATPSQGRAEGPLRRRRFPRGQAR